MPPTPNFFLQASTVAYLNKIRDDASSIELLALITMRAQSEDELVDLKSKLVMETNQKRGQSAAD